MMNFWCTIDQRGERERCPALIRRQSSSLSYLWRLSHDRQEIGGRAKCCHNTRTSASLLSIHISPIICQIAPLGPSCPPGIIEAFNLYLRERSELKQSWSHCVRLSDCAFSNPRLSPDQSSFIRGNLLSLSLVRAPVPPPQPWVRNKTVSGTSVSAGRN